MDFIKLVLKTILVTVTAFATLVAISFGLGLWSGLEAYEDMQNDKTSFTYKP